MPIAALKRSILVLVARKEMAGCLYYYLYKHHLENENRTRAAYCAPSLPKDNIRQPTVGRLNAYAGLLPKVNLAYRLATARK